METSCEILQFLHYHPLSSHEEIRAGINFHDALLGIEIDLCTQMLQRFHGDMHVFDARQILDYAGRLAQNRSRNDGDCGILAAADADGTFQPLPTGDEHSFFCHAYPPCVSLKNIETKSIF